jgi:toxin CcdB
MAGIARKELGVEVADLSHHRQDIISAIDFLITGI